MKKIAVLIQGPHSKDLRGFDTINSIKTINSFSDIRENFYLIASVWEDEPNEIKEEINSLVDKMVEAKKPDYMGSCNRSFQSQGVAQGLAAIDESEFDYVLKTRSDMELSEKFLKCIIEQAQSGSEKLLVTNLFTRFENYHISDMMVFSTFENIKAYFDPSINAHYEDLYSPEVQFARMFVRNKGLAYSFRLDDYLAFIKDWVDIVDFNEYEIIWYKDATLTIKELNRHGGIIFDRDCGPFLTRLFTANSFNFIKNTKIPLFYIASVFLFLDVLERTFVYMLMKIFKRTFKNHFYFVDTYGGEFGKPIPNEQANISVNFWEKMCYYFNIQADIDELAKKYKGKKVLLYGAGIFARTIFKNYDLSELDVMGISDIKFKGESKEQFLSYQAYSPKEIKNLEFDVIIIMTFDAIGMKENYLEKELQLIGYKYDRIFCYQDLVRGLNF